MGRRAGPDRAATALMRTLIVRALAEADIDEAYAWYAARSVQAAARSLDTAALTLTAITQHPESFPTAYPGLRREA